MADDLISRRALLKKRFNMYMGFCGNVPVVAVEDVDNAPAADAAEVVHGRWIFGHTIGRAWMKCSECLKSQMPNGCFTYCPNCGAKMNGEGGEG